MPSRAQEDKSLLVGSAVIRHLDVLSLPPSHQTFYPFPLFPHPHNERSADRRWLEIIPRVCLPWVPGTRPGTCPYHSLLQKILHVDSLICCPLEEVMQLCVPLFVYSPLSFWSTILDMPGAG